MMHISSNILFCSTDVPLVWGQHRQEFAQKVLPYGPSPKYAIFAPFPLLLCEGDMSGLSEHPITTVQTDKKQIALSLLPSPEDDCVLKRNITMLIGRVLFNNLPWFKAVFDGCVDWHLVHEYSKEMSTQSEWVS